MKKIFISLILLSVLAVSVYGYSRRVMSELEGSLIRLHIIADSDTEYDQSIKLKVRDEILKSAGNISVKDPDEFCKAAEAAANSYLINNNIGYTARAEYGSYYFPRKRYKNITLPSGKYNGVRVVLGNGRGHNWWCIMYPPLCVSGKDAYADKKASRRLKELLGSDAYELITDHTENAKIKLRIVELFGK